LGGAVSRARLLGSGLWKLEAKFRGVQILGPVTFHGRPLLSVAPESDFVMEGDNTLASSTRANPLGNSQPCVLRTLAPGAVLRLKRGVAMSGAVVCAARSIEIGQGTILGSGALIIDNDFHEAEGEFGWTDARSTARPVRIGRGCFIGARAIVLKGVTIGDRAIVGAGAVVSKDVPAGMLAVGNPAQVVARGR